MDQNTPHFKSLAIRKIDVIKKNLLSVCGLNVKSLIDKASFSNIEDGCEELINFTANLEQILLHQIRPQKNWYGGAESIHFWTYLRTACKNIPQSCIKNIDSIENIKSATAKGRAFIRCALMEKRLSEYITTAVKQAKLTKKYYMEGAILLSEEVTMVCGVLLGLNSIDFSFCLKGQNMDLLGPLVIDYTPFMKYHQSIESKDSDEEEMKTSSYTVIEDENTDIAWKDKYKILENKYRGMTEQKGYLEELLRMRENQLEEAGLQHNRFVQTITSMEMEHNRERSQLEQVILELQAQLYNLKSDHNYLQQRVQMLTASNQLALGQVKEIQMTEMAGDRIHSEDKRSFQDSNSEHQSFTSSTEGSHKVRPNVSDNHSLMSINSEQIPQTVREDSQSLVPLTGSLASYDAKSVDMSQKETTSTSQVNSPDHSASHAISQSQDFENISLQVFEDLTNGNSQGSQQQEVKPGQVDTISATSTSKTAEEDNSLGTESPIMVTSSESDEPIHINLEDVTRNSEIEINESLVQEVADKSSSSIEDVTKDTNTETATNNQLKPELNTSSDSTSSTEEPVHLDHESLNKRNSDSGSSDTTSWEVTQDRDLQVLSDENPEDEGKSEDQN